MKTPMPGTDGWSLASIAYVADWLVSGQRKIDFNGDAADHWKADGTTVLIRDSARITVWCKGGRLLKAQVKDRYGSEKTTSYTVLRSWMTEDRKRH